MTKSREKTRAELTAEIEDGQKKIRQFENRKKMLRQKLSREERRERNHRLIVRGAVFESIVPEAKTMTDEEAAALLRLALPQPPIEAAIKSQTSGTEKSTTTPIKAAQSIRKSCCRPTRRPLSLTALLCGTVWSFTRKPGTPGLQGRLTRHSPQNYHERNRYGLSGNTVPLNLFPKECAPTSAYTTKATEIPIVISCLLCDHWTGAAHGRRSPKRNMTLTRKASLSG